LCHIADRPVADDSQAAKNFANHCGVSMTIGGNHQHINHCGVSMTIGGNHQHITGLYQIQGMEHRAEIRWLAQRRHRSAKQTRLPTRRAERMNGRVNLARRVADVHRNSDWYLAPPIDFGMEKRVNRTALDSNRHGSSPAMNRAASHLWMGSSVFSRRA
jgi:hypothetical protein